MNIEEQHKKDVEKLGELENELIELIFETKNEILINKFSEWVDQRAKCNDGFTKWFKTKLKG